MFQAADQVLNLPGTDLGGSEVQGHLPTQCGLRRLKPLPRRRNIALEQVHRHVEDRGSPPNAIGFIGLQLALALPPRKRPLRDGDESGNLLQGKAVAFWNFAKRLKGKPARTNRTI